MSDLKLTVALTSSNGENMSRHDMLQWVNTMVQGHFKKIEELSSGVAYCQMMELIFPNCINLKRVKMSAKLEHECLHNLKLFQSAFTRLKLDKAVPIDRLIKGRFQDNFEFLQWFKKFFDSQAPGLENIKSAANAPIPKPIKPRGFAKELAKAVSPPSNGTGAEEDLTTRDLMSEMQTLSIKIDGAIVTRDECYNKLLQIERLMDDVTNSNNHAEFCSRIYTVLYKTMDGQPSAEIQGINGNAVSNSEMVEPEADGEY
ncbi:microtubule-associated protein RP/EB family member 2 isoform X1 [Drosophila pseudoobscura]|uniref:Microtubule-associated protein RP/EB family member 2 isoform X1 n=2 Tax=Drosophila pseudoobscura pseudoobscura TaxID=46245 RepID=A0A6I8UTU2_DROPS|nr:microtubule-associated protein RP/EB family member 2 isoform X1 [Drosophila pseudoobscura]